MVWANYSDLSRGHSNGGLVRESPPNPLNSGLGIIVICPDWCISRIDFTNFPEKKIWILDDVKGVMFRVTFPWPDILSDEKSVKTHFKNVHSHYEQAFDAWLLFGAIFRATTTLGSTE